VDIVIKRRRIMLHIETLKRQHEGINDAISGIKKSLKITDLEREAFEISQKISLLAGVLKIHLGTEDRYMYPQLMQSESNELKKVAKEYVEEMGNISGEFIDYKNRFNTKTKIVSDTKGFINETERILKILEERIEKEDSNLYSIF
jgi:hemerythrin-like domain-containing protein